MAKQHVRVELYYDGAWQSQTRADGSTRVYTRDPIEITRGRGEQQGEPTPSTATLTFSGLDDNGEIDDRYNPRNPTSDLYGKIGRNTPIRISNGPAAALEDDFNRSVSNGWTGGDFTWTLSGGTNPDDYDINGTHGTHTHPSTNVLHYSYANTGSVNHRVRAVVKLSAGTLTGANASVWVLGRMTDPSNYYAALVTMTTAGDVTMGIFKRVGGTLSQIVAPVTTHAGYSGLFDDYQFGIELLVEGSTLRAKMWDASNYAEPTSYSIRGTDTSLTTGTNAGVAGRRETGNTNANLEFRYDSFLAVSGTIRFTGEVASWRPRRAVKGDVWTEVTAKGVLHRLSQGATPLRSALWRAIQSSSPVAHWPINEGSNALSIASALSGGPALSVSMFDYTTGDPATISWESRSVAPWLEPIATPATGLVLRFQGPITMDPGTTSWVGDYIFAADPDAAATGQVVVVWMGNGDGTAASPRTEWIFGFFDAGSGTSWELTRRVRAASVTDTLVSSGLVSYADGKPKHARLTTTLDGADVDWEIELNAVTLGSGTLVASNWEPLASVDVQSTANAGQVSMGQVAAWADTTPAANAANATAVGRSEEYVADRLSRLCSEEGIPFTLVGTISDTMLAGPQPLDTLVGQFAECERTDGGLLFETRTGQGITYRTRTDLYSQTAALTLDFDAGEIAPPIEPDIDDQNVRNDITVANRDGTSARAIQETGSLNIQSPTDDPDGVGRYDVQYDVNVDFDHEALLTQIATWQRHLGTDESTRYPTVTADLDAAPALAVDVDLFDLGDALAIDNLEADQITQLVPGYGEQIGSHRRLWTANCVPATPWDVVILDESRLDTGGSDLTNNENSTTTAFELDVAGTAIWSTADEPYDLVVGGERVTVTVNNDSSSPQDVTVTRSVNGVVKSHSAGDPVRLAEPRVLAL